jgi:hypothetical protein
LQVIDLRLPDRLVIRPQPVKSENKDADKPGHKPT